MQVQLNFYVSWMVCAPFIFTSLPPNKRGSIYQVVCCMQPNKRGRGCMTELTVEQNAPPPVGGEGRPEWRPQNARESLGPMPFKLVGTRSAIRPVEECAAIGLRIFLFLEVFWGRTTGHTEEVPTWQMELGRLPGQILTNKRLDSCQIHSNKM